MENTSETKPALDSAHDILNLQDHPLTPFFKPKTVALIGASEREGSVGRTTLVNLLSGGFKGKIFVVNPKRDQILGQPAFKSIGDIPQKIDLVIITTAAQTVPQVIKECIDKGITSAVIISAGFKETGPAGKKLEDEILALARGKMRLIGPNCLGLISPICGLNATFAQDIAKPGNVAFISQSGALCTAILDWSLRESFGFSGFVSTGSMADVGWGDLIDYFGADPKTNSIVIYMESIGNARAFLSAAREVSLNKPIIVIKAGRTPEAAKAAASHTGSLTGSDEVLDAAFQRCGVLRVNEISEVFHLADLLGKQPLPEGRRLAIVTNAGGPGVLATDALTAGGGQLASLSAETLAHLNAFLPPAWSHANPIDVLGDAEADRYAKTLKFVVDEKESDGVLVITTPQGMTKSLDIAENLIPYARESKKPILASWMGGAQALEGIEALSRAGIPTFPFPDSAVKAFNYMWQSRENLKMLYQTPTVSTHKDDEAIQVVKALVADIRASGRNLLTEYESKQILEAYGIPTVPTKIAKTADAAAEIARNFGFPVVLKIHSETITHKTDVGGVHLNLNSELDVRSAFTKIQANVSAKASAKDFLGVTVQPMIPLDGYEIILGSSVDPQFGPVLLFGMGGQLVEVFKDRALALPPLTTTLARRMMEKTKIFKALLGVRGRQPVDILQLEQILVTFSKIVVNHPEISEMDINPLLASENRLTALDARIVLHDRQIKVLPTPAIRPYPIQYAHTFVLKNQEAVQIRPIRPDDEARVRSFHSELSEQTVYARYLKPFHLSERTTHERLTRVCFIDYDREMALVGIQLEKNLNENESPIVGIARMKKDFTKTKADISVIIVDALQGQGLGLELTKDMIQVAKDEGLKEISTAIRTDNKAMLAIFKKLNFTLTPLGEGLIASRKL
jgi:acetyltransferase